MDRSNSVSSSSSSGSLSRHSAEPFAYQTRILERSSSGIRSHVSLPKNGVLTPTNSGRRWTPSHRSGASLDTVRGKWEERARTEAALNNQIISSASPSKSSFDLDDEQLEERNSRDTTTRQPDDFQTPTRPHASRASTSIADEPSSPPALTKRHTMPDTIIASPLSPNSTGLSIVAPDSTFATAAPTNRIRFPMSRPSVSSVREKFNKPSPESSPDMTSSFSTLGHRSRRSVDFDSIMKNTQPSPSQEKEEKSTYTREIVTKRQRPVSLYSSQPFSSLRSSTSSASADPIPRSKSPEKMASTSFEKVDKLSRSSFTSSSPQGSPKPSQIAQSQKSQSSSSSSDIFGSPSSSDKFTSKPVTLPRRNSVKDSPFLRSSSPTKPAPAPVEIVEEISVAHSPKIQEYRPPPLAPSSFANASSVMTPTPYRSSYMANKKAGMYGDSLSVGRRLGRHLPRIASGDAYDEPENEIPDPEPHNSVLPSLPATPEKSQKIIVTPKKSRDKSPEPLKQLSRLERREKRLREWKMELDNKSPFASPAKTSSAKSSPSKSIMYSPELSSFAVPHASELGAASGDDVHGVAGRKRLSRDIMALPNSPLGNAMPTPSSRLGLRHGLWADQQRHLLRAYEYLCHVGEAQQWIEGCLGEELGFGVVEMEESLRDGVVLAKLSRVYMGEDVVKKIFEVRVLIDPQGPHGNHESDGTCVDAQTSLPPNGEHQLLFPLHTASGTARSKYCRTNHISS